MDLKDFRPIMPPTLRGNGERNPGKAWSDLENFNRQVADELLAMRSILLNLGIAPKSAIAAEDGIRPGMLVCHIGETAYRAVCTNPARLATGVVTDVTKRRLTIWALGTWKTCCIPYTQPTSRLLYLSSQPGYATDVAPDASGSIRQMIGFKKGDVRDNAGRAPVHLQCGETFDL